MACSGKITVSDADNLALRGNVKAVKEDFFLAGNSFDRVVPEKILYMRSYTFDKRGNFLEIVREDMLYRPKQACPTLDTLVNEQAMDSIPLSTDSVKISVTSLVPKTDNDELKYGIGEEPYALEKYVYTNDSICIVNIFDRDNKIIAYEERRYSGDKLVQINRYAALRDVLLSKMNFTYDGKGQLIGKTTYYEKKYYEVSYKHGFGKKYESYNYNFVNYEYCFNLDGQISRKRKYNGKNLLSTTRYTYNEKGDVEEESESDDNMGLVRETKYSYQYDEYGNWTECIERRFDGNVFLRKRMISYH